MGLSVGVAPGLGSLHVLRRADVVEGANPSAPLEQLLAKGRQLLAEREIPGTHTHDWVRLQRDLRALVDEDLSPAARGLLVANVLETLEPTARAHVALGLTHLLADGQVRLLGRAGALAVLRGCELLPPEWSSGPVAHLTSELRRRGSLSVLELAGATLVAEGLSLTDVASIAHRLRRVARSGKASQSLAQLVLIFAAREEEHTPPSVLFESLRLASLAEGPRRGGLVERTVAVGLRLARRDSLPSATVTPAPRAVTSLVSSLLLPA